VSSERPWSLLFLILITFGVATSAEAQLVMGAGPGSSPQIRVIDADGTERTFLAYAADFLGGVRVAFGDVDGDGILDIITSGGPGGGPHITVRSGADLSYLASFFAYDPAFTGGVWVAAGDVNGDGLADIITGPGPGGGPHVTVRSGADLSYLASFFAYDPAFSGGVTVAAGDVNGDGQVDIWCTCTPHPPGTWHPARTRHRAREAPGTERFE
jgi:hypothetical protein